MRTEPSHEAWEHARAAVADRKRRHEPIFNEKGLLRWLAEHYDPSKGKSRKASPNSPGASEGLRLEPWEELRHGCGYDEDLTLIRCRECGDYGDEPGEHPKHYSGEQYNDDLGVLVDVSCSHCPPIP